MWPLLQSSFAPDSECIHPHRPPYVIKGNAKLRVMVISIHTAIVAVHVLRVGGSHAYPQERTGATIVGDERKQQEGHRVRGELIVG